MFNKNKNIKPKKNWLLGAFLFFYVIKKVVKVRKSRELKEIEGNFKSYLKEEGKEIKKYVQGKESIAEFAEDSGSIFKDYFVPHSGNNHMPKILHTKSLAFIVILSLILKFSLVAYLYFIFPNPGKADDIMVAKIFELINAERKSASLSPLQQNPALSSSAMAKANDMVTQDYFAHTSPDGRKPWDFIDRNQYAFSIVGENLAMNFTTAESAHKALVNSPTHKHNLLNEKYQDVGLAVVSGIVGGKQTNVLVQLFSSKVSIEDTDKTTEPKQELVKSVEEPIKEVSVLAAEQKNEKTEEIKKPEIKPIAKVEEVEARPKESEDVKQETVMKPKVEKIEKPVQVDKENEEKISKAPEVKGIEKTEEIIDKTSDIESSTSSIVTKVIKHPGDQVLSEMASERFNIEQMEISRKENSLPVMNLSIENVTDSHFIFSKRLIHIIQVCIAGILSLLIISLLLNIFIRFEIQHKPVLIRTVLVMVFVAALLFINFHYLESGSTMIYMS